MIEEVPCRTCQINSENCVSSIKYIKQDLPITPETVIADNCYSTGDTGGYNYDDYNYNDCCIYSDTGIGGGGLSLNAYASFSSSMYSDSDHIYVDAHITGCGGLDLNVNGCQVGPCRITRGGVVWWTSIECTCYYHVYFDYSSIPNIEQVAVEYTITMSAGGGVWGIYRYPRGFERSFNGSYSGSQTEKYIESPSFWFRTYIQVVNDYIQTVRCPIFCDHCNQSLGNCSANINCTLNIDLKLTAIIKVEY